MLAQVQPFFRPEPQVGGVTMNKDNSQFTYDVIKIVDEFGSPIQPNFDNWVAAVEKTPQFLNKGSGCNKQGTYNSNV